MYEVGAHSSERSFPNVGLCFVPFRDSLSAGSLCTGGGVPIVARAIDFTAFATLNFFFFRVAIASLLASRTLALCNNRVLPSLGWRACGRTRHV